MWVGDKPIERRWVRPREWLTVGECLCSRRWGQKVFMKSIGCLELLVCGLQHTELIEPRGAGKASSGPKKKRQLTYQRWSVGRPVLRLVHCFTDISVGRCCPVAVDKGAEGWGLVMNWGSSTTDPSDPTPTGAGPGPNVVTCRGVGLALVGQGQASRPSPVGWGETAGLEDKVLEVFVAGSLQMRKRPTSLAVDPRW